MATVPQEDAQTQETPVDVAAIVNACARPLPSARMSIFYRAAVWTSATALLLVTALYFTLVVVVAWLACDYFISHLRLLQSDEQIGQILLYALPPIFVLALLALMVKPMFQVRPAATEPRQLEYSDAPLLYDLVERICKNLQTPMVDEIRVLLGSNGSVQMAGIMGGIFSQRRQLNLGLSLVSGFTIQELAGVIAHEMGHFSLDRNIRLLAMIRWVNGWFARAVYERDAFDVWLEYHTRPGASFRYLLFPILWIVVAGRGVLRPFYFLSEAASCLISRKDEYDCDRCMAALVGSARSNDALKKTYLLDLASDMSMSEMDSSWLERRLPDNIPRLVAARADRFSGRQVDISYKLMTFQKGHWLSSHPSPADRIAAVRRLDIDGLNVDDGPAMLLLPQFDQVARELTIEFYKLLLKDKYDAGYLVDAETLNREFQEAEQTQRTLKRYLQIEPNLCRPIFPSDSYASARSSLEHSTQGLAALLSKTKDEQAEFAKISNEMLAHRHAGNELQVYQKLSNFGFVTTGDLRPMLQYHEKEYARVCEEYDKLAETIRKRMTLALQLLHTPAFLAEYPADDWDMHTTRIQPLLAACKLLQEEEDEFEKLVVQSETLNLIGANVGFDSIPFVAQREVDSLSKSTADRLTQIREKLNHAQNPLAPPGEEHRLGDFLIPKVPSSSNISELVGTSIESLQRIDKLTARSMGLIAETCEEVETSLRLSHLEDRKELDWWEQLDAELDSPQRRSSESSLTAAALSPIMGIVVAFFAGGLIAAIGSIGEQTAKSLPHHPSYQPTIVPTGWSESYHASAMPVYQRQPGAASTYEEFNVRPLRDQPAGSQSFNTPEQTFGQGEYEHDIRGRLTNPQTPGHNVGRMSIEKYDPTQNGSFGGSPTPGSTLPSPRSAISRPGSSYSRPSPTMPRSSLPGSSLPGRGFP